MKLLILSIAWIPFAFSAEPIKPPSFPIIAWNMMDENVPVSGFLKDPQKFKVMKDCGFNTACMVTPTLLNECQEAGLSAWVFDSALYNFISEKMDEKELKNKIEALVKKTVANPATLGYVIKDEPNASLFPHIKKASDLFSQMSGGKPFYVNLFPTYAPLAALGTSTYQQHLDEYIKICKPTFLAYDFYGMNDNGQLSEGYWKNMELVYNTGKKANLPVYPVILSVTCASFRELSEADILFQVFTHLAHGAKGIQYFTYFTPPYSNFRNAPIDQFGDKTPMWSIVKRTNQRLHILGPILSTLKWERSYHLGANLPPEVRESVVNPESLVQEVQDVSRNVPVDAFVGEFTAPDMSKYVIVVNKDLKKSVVMAMKWKGTPKATNEIETHKRDQRIEFIMG